MHACMGKHGMGRERWRGEGRGKERERGEKRVPNAYGFEAFLSSIHT